MNTSWRSPNFNERKQANPDYVVLHYTGMHSATEALERLCDPAAEVSAHYLVDESGQVFALVDEDKRAWHAGVSYWAKQRDMNSASIGIEIVNPGHEFGYRHFPNAQIEAVQALCLEIAQRYGFKPSAFLAHSDIAPERKQDPGEYFPWKALAKVGVGLWPLHAQEGDQEPDVSMLHAVGYNPNCEEELLWQAFHRRYLPERLDHPADYESMAVAEKLWLMKKREKKSEDL